MIVLQGSLIPCRITGAQNCRPLSRVFLSLFLCRIFCLSGCNLLDRVFRFAFQVQQISLYYFLSHNIAFYNLRVSLTQQYHQMSQIARENNKLKILVYGAIVKMSYCLSPYYRIQTDLFGCISRIVMAFQPIAWHWNEVAFGYG